MGRKRKKASVRRQTPGGRVSAELYARVTARCRDQRVKRNVWKVGQVTEVAYELLMLFSPLVQRELVEIHELDPGFWARIQSGARQLEPELLQLLQHVREDLTGGDVPCYPYQTPAAAESTNQLVSAVTRSAAPSRRSATTARPAASHG